MKTWEDVVCDLGEDLEIPYGKVEELLELAIYVLKAESKLPRNQIVVWLLTAATENYALVKELFLKTMMNAEDLKSQKAMREMDKDMRKLENLLKSLTKMFRPT